MKWININFAGKSDSGKTNIYMVSCEGTPLGMVKWYAPWRKYTFFPAPVTLFEQDCLRDIADFVEAETKAHKDSKKASSPKE